MPRCTPDKSSVRCGTLSVGGRGGLRLPHAAMKAKIKRQKAKSKNRLRRTPLIFAFLLLPFA
ncbi:MAG TPA: hypothetical protein VGC87_06685 [Pyrinomonadaceae bacterium]